MLTGFIITIIISGSIAAFGYWGTQKVDDFVAQALGFWIMIVAAIVFLAGVTITICLPSWEHQEKLNAECVEKGGVPYENRCMSPELFVTLEK